MSKMIPISEDEINYLERLWFEYSGFLTLSMQFISDSEIKPDKKMYNKVLKNYIESFAMYNISIAKIAYNHIIESPDTPLKQEFLDSLKVNSELTFNSYTKMIVIK